MLKVDKELAQALRTPMYCRCPTPDPIKTYPSHCNNCGWAIPAAHRVSTQDEMDNYLDALAEWRRWRHPGG